MFIPIQMISTQFRWVILSFLKFGALKGIFYTLAQIRLYPYATFHIYRGADKSLARPGRKKATATEDFDVHISYL
jgi:membrane protein CcdC involved in cytochrome C biogenesis